jgi:hypothetical protein
LAQIRSNATPGVLGADIKGFHNTAAVDAAWDDTAWELLLLLLPPEVAAATLKLALTSNAAA